MYERSAGNPAEAVRLGRGLTSRLERVDDHWGPGAAATVTSCFDEGARYGGPSDVNQLLGKSLSRQMALGDAGVKMGRAVSVTYIGVFGIASNPKR